MSAEIFEHAGKLGHALIAGALDSHILGRLRVLRLSGLSMGLLAVSGLLGLGVLLLRLSGLRVLWLSRLVIACLLRLSILLLGLSGLAVTALLRLRSLRAVVVALRRLLTNAAVELIVRTALAVVGIVVYGHAAADGAAEERPAVGRLLLVVLLSRFEAGEARSDDGDFDFVLNVGVDAGAEDDVCRGIDNAADKLGCVCDFVESEVGAADNVENDAAGALRLWFQAEGC